MVQIQRADQLAGILRRTRSAVISIDYAEAGGFMGWGAGVERSMIEVAQSHGFRCIARRDSGPGPRFRWVGRGNRTLRLTFERVADTSTAS